MGKTLHKTLTVAVSAMTAMWSVGVAAFAPLAAAAAPSAAAVSEGDLVKASLPAVYYVGANGKRYVFPNEKTYKTWWSNFNTVETITDAALASIAIGGNVTYRPGARLAKITTDPKVYMVGANAELHAIADESTAVDLFGSSWAQKIDDVPDAFFTNYTVASEVVATSLGLGALPVGTVVWMDSEAYFVAEDDVYLIDGNVSIYSAAVMASSDSEFEAWTGLSVDDVTGTVDAEDLIEWVSPDRKGALEGGTSTPNEPSPEGISVEVKKVATNLAMSSANGVVTAGSENIGKSVVEVCADETITVDGFKVTTVNGTIGFNTIIAWFQDVTGGSIYEVSGTSSGDSVGEFEATENEVTFSGCKDFAFYAATASNGGILDMRLTEVMVSGASAAVSVNAGNSKLQARNAVPVTATDLMDITFSSPTAPSALQTDGTKQQIFTVQANVSNNDAYIPNVVFKLNGSIMVSSCELRISGVVSSTNYKWVNGKYLVFELPEDKRVQIETTRVWELWCNVDGEAGQTVTPQLVWPAPYFWFFDNVRVQAAVATDEGINREAVAPNGSRLTFSAAAAINLAGASITLEVANLNNVKLASGAQADDELTSGSTNALTAVYKVKVRGSAATLSALQLALTLGTDNTEGLTACQIKIGQRNDKGEIITTSINLADFSLSNFGGENNVTNAINPTINASKKLQVGDWLIIVECDVTSLSAPYDNNDSMAVTLLTGANNVSFDVGTTVNFPTANTAASIVTVKLLSALAVASNNTVRFLVGNSTDVILGEYTITAPSQEGVNVTSIGFTFEGSGAAANNIVGVDGCTTVTLENVNGTDLSTSQSLTATGADVTLTFTVSFSIAANQEYKVRVVCVQGASAPTAGTVTNATTFTSIAGTGSVSSQSFTTAAGLPLAGANVTKAASGTVTSNVTQSQPNQIIGPNEQLKIMTISVSASIHEDQSLNRLRVTLTPGTQSLVTDLNNIIFKGEGFTINGASAAAETTFCQRLAAAIVDCLLNDNNVVLGAGQTGTITVYATGNSLGSIGNDPLPGDGTPGTITPSLDLDTDSDSQVIFKGAESQALVFNTSDPAAANGRVVTPAGATVRLVNKNLPSTFLPGGANMVLGKMDLIVGSNSITFLELSGQCNTSDTTNVCNDGEDTVTVALDNTVMAGGADLALSAADPALFDGSVITDTIISIGTHDLELRYTDAGVVCSTDDTVYLATTEFGFSVQGVPTVTQSFASAGPAAFPNTILPDMNTQAGFRLAHPTNSCG